MKKLLSTLILYSLFATPGMAILAKDVTSITTDFEWNVIDDFENQTSTYWYKFTGNYDIQLGEASILSTAGEGGTISVYTTGDWSTNYGIGVVANKNPYDMQGNEPGNLGLYVCHPVTHNSPRCIEYYINDYRYIFSARTVTVENKELGIAKTVGLPGTEYSQKAQASVYGEGTKLTFGYTMSGEMDENGNLIGLRFSTPRTFETPEGTTLTLDAYLNSEGNYAILPNMQKPFDLTYLTSTGTSHVDTGLAYGLDNDAETYIVITKALRASAVPEPTTATLSLLALAGLAARRRRK